MRKMKYIMLWKRMVVFFFSFIISLYKKFYNLCFKSKIAQKMSFHAFFTLFYQFYCIIECKLMRGVIYLSCIGDNLQKHEVILMVISLCHFFSYLMEAIILWQYTSNLFISKHKLQIRISLLCSLYL